MRTWKEILIESSMVTLLSINLSLGAVILVRDFIPLNDSIPSITEPAPPSLQTEYVMELVETKQEEDYRVEKYQEFQVEYDKNRREIRRAPTDKVEYIPYYTRQ